MGRNSQSCEDSGVKMKKEFVKTWNSSRQPRKQRKYSAKAPLHTKSKFLRVHLSKELREKYGKRSLRARTGDKVKILKGQFAKTEGKIESVDLKKSKLYIAKAELQKKDGSKSKYPINPSNVLLTELNTDDKKRMEKLTGKQSKVAK